MHPRARCKRRGDFVMKNFRLASGSACQTHRQDEQAKGCARGALSLFPTAAVCFYGSARLNPTKRGRLGNYPRRGRKDFSRGLAYNLSCRS